jgi:hypothetical protein
MTDLLELVTTLSDADRHPEIAMAAYKPEVVITTKHPSPAVRVTKSSPLSED